MFLSWESRLLSTVTKTSQAPSWYLTFHTRWKTVLTEQHSKREWANPWEKKPGRPIKYKDISYRLLGEDSWELSCSACPDFALLCRHLVLAMIGDWVPSEMDSLANLLKSSLCTLASCSQVTNGENSTAMQVFYPEQQCSLDFAQGIRTAKRV